MNIEELSDQVIGLRGAIDQLDARCAENELWTESVRVWTLELSAAILSIADMAGETLAASATSEAPVEALLRPILVGLFAVGDLATRAAVAVQGAPRP